jgi:tetratricopeptide (TPR) repeat protein
MVIRYPLIVLTTSWLFAAMAIGEAQLGGQRANVTQELEPLPSSIEAARLLRALPASKFPIIRSAVAAAHLSSARAPLAAKSWRFWRILAGNLQNQKVQGIARTLIEQRFMTAESPKAMADAWPFLLGQIAVQQSNYAAAERHFAQVRSSSTYYQGALLEQAMAAYKLGNEQKALSLLRTLAREMEASSSKSQADNLLSLVNLTIARIQFDLKDYAASIKSYRRVGRESVHFQTALREQSWSLLYSGQAGFALGAIYSAETSFFRQRFDPEYTLLKPMIFYSLCNYQDSYDGIIEFARLYREPMEQLQRYLSADGRIEQDTFDLLDRHLSKRRSNLEPLSAGVVEMALENPLVARELAQFVAVLRERDALNVWRHRMTAKQAATTDAMLRRMIAASASDLAKSFAWSLQQIHDQYRQLRDRAELLYIDVLSALKDHTGAVRIASLAGVKVGSDRVISQIWSGDGLEFSANKYEEHWWDEVGYHVMPVRNQCSNEKSGGN